MINLRWLRLHRLLVAALATLAPAAPAAAQAVALVRHELVIRDFRSLDLAIERYRPIFDGIDANDLIMQAHTWKAHDIGRTPGFGGDTPAALRSIRIPVLYMPQ